LQNQFQKINRNPPSNQSRNKTLRQRSPGSQLKKPNINNHYPSRNQIVTLKNKTKIIIPETK